MNIVNNLFMQTTVNYTFGFIRNSPDVGKENVDLSKAYKWVQKFLLLGNEFFNFFCKICILINNEYGFFVRHSSLFKEENPAVSSVFFLFLGTAALLG